MRQCLRPCFRLGAECGLAALVAIDSPTPTSKGGGGRWPPFGRPRQIGAGAGRLLADAGRYSATGRALATASTRSAGPSSSSRGAPARRRRARRASLGACTLAGRVNEASAAATDLSGELTTRQPVRRPDRGHLRLGHAAVTASPAAGRRHIAAASASPTRRRTRACRPSGVLPAEWPWPAATLPGLPGGRRPGHDERRPRRARCHAYVIGVVPAASTTCPARRGFEATAPLSATTCRCGGCGPPHELATSTCSERVDMDRLIQARRLGEQDGALSTVVGTGPQLSTSFTAPGTSSPADAHASCALR